MDVTGKQHSPERFKALTALLQPSLQSLLKCHHFAHLAHKLENHKKLNEYVAVRLILPLDIHSTNGSPPKKSIKFSTDQIST